MEIVQLKVMRGPNYWSVDHHKLIVLKIRYNQEEQKYYTPARAVPMGSIELSFQTLSDSNSVRELICRTALILQRMAGMENSFFEIPEDKDCLVFSYSIERAGVHAAHMAVALINSIVADEEFDLPKGIENLHRIRKRESMGPSTQAIADEATKRNIPVARFNRSSLTYLGQGRNQQFFQAAVTGTTSSIACGLAQDKNLTKTILKRGGISIPEGLVVSKELELKGALEKLGYPLAIKPLNGNHGRGITTNISNQADALAAFKTAQQISRNVIVERHVDGLDHRFLVINYKLVAVARRTPACVTGDGVSTIRELVDRTNKDPGRGEGHENLLTKITIDDLSLKLLHEEFLTPESIVEAGRVVPLKSTANLSTGGTADDVTDDVHPDNVFLAERIARLMHLDICGIDILTKDVTQPITNKNGAVVEVNSGPGLRMHIAPSAGKPRNVAAPIVDMLFPDGSSGRIPLVAVTGTNGKTTTTRLIAHLASHAGFTPGFTTTDGIYIDGQLIEAGDCSGPRSASLVLADPIVDFAVLECARGGILRSGLGFDKCNVSVVTNISEDHLGIDGINTIEGLARVKAVVPKCTFDSGYSILNADDDLVFNMREGLSCNIALFSLDACNPRILKHINNGKMAAYVDQNAFYISVGGEKQLVAPIDEVPLTFKGNAECMIKNVMPAILAAFVSDIPVSVIRQGLLSFIPSADSTPGRMNNFEFSHFNVLLDYAHNEDGMLQIQKYAENVRASKKVGIIAAAGDRRPEDIRSIGKIAAETFDELIIRHDKDGRGRTNEEITSLLLEGMSQVDAAIPVKIISKEIEAAEFVIRHAKPGSWIFINTEQVHETSSYLKELHRVEMNEA